MYRLEWRTAYALTIVLFWHLSSISVKTTLWWAHDKHQRGLFQYVWRILTSFPEVINSAMVCSGWWVSLGGNNGTHSSLFVRYYAEPSVMRGRYLTFTQIVPQDEECFSNRESNKLVWGHHLMLWNSRCACQVPDNRLPEMVSYRMGNGNCCI